MATEDDFVLVFDESGGGVFGGAIFRRGALGVENNVLIPTVICTIEYVGISTQMCASALSASATSTNSAKEAKAVIFTRDN